MSNPYFDTLMGHGPKQMLHMERESSPDAKTHPKGIRYYDQSQLCRGPLRLA